MAARLLRVGATFLANIGRFSARNSAVRSINQTFATSTRATWSSVILHFIDTEGIKSTVEAKVGDSIQEIATESNVNLECACGGTLSCSTCHVIFDADEMGRLDLEEADDEEVEMLKKSYSGYTETSRLGCQVVVTKAFDGITLTIPVSKDQRDD